MLSELLFIAYFLLQLMLMKCNKIVITYTVQTVIMPYILNIGVCVYNILDIKSSQ